MAASPLQAKPLPNGILGHFREHYVAYALASLLTAYTTFATEDRFTGRDADKVDNRLNILESQVRTLPPRELLERVTRLEIEHNLMKELKSETLRLSRELESLRATVIRVEARVSNGLRTHPRVSP